MGYVQAGIAFFGFLSSMSASKKAQALAEEGGRLSKEASYLNANDVEYLGAVNAGVINQMAAKNAAGIRDVGYANALAIAEATHQNLWLHQLQTQEELRIQERDERWHAGEIRAMTASTGIAVNGGSPVAYLKAEIAKGIQERRFMELRGNLTGLRIADDGMKKTLLTVKSANWDAKIIQDNAALKAEVTMLEALAQAASMRRQGDISEMVGVANAQAARANGMSAALGYLSKGIGYAGQAYASFQTPSQASYGVGTYNTSTQMGGF